MPVREWDELRCLARGMLIVIAIATFAARAADSAFDEHNSKPRTSRNLRSPHKNTRNVFGTFRYS